ncbi:MAG: sulfate adenylyltransferase subunit CysN [Planctomycetota bacterium]|nr:sulfate adenylyltransferase subunit CysN [Planctomycetota bacterium]
MTESELIRQNILAYLDQHQKKDLLRFLTAGSVDDGKSTLIGRLLFDSKTVYDDHLEALKRDSAKKSSAGGEVDYSLLVDGLQSEREQGITIDVAYRYFATPKRKFIIADTPGHEQYTRNMATGASTANLAVILIDARHGVLAQTKRHSFIASLLGIKHIVVAINKMDLVDFSQERFDQIRDDYTDFAARLEVSDIRFIPICAKDGDNIVERSRRMPWYEGTTVLNFLETVHIASDRNLIDLRFPVQYVTRPNLNFRGFAGTVASGIIRKGDEVMALPSGRKSRVKSIVTYDGELDEAFPPQAVTVTLEDEIDVGRGDMLVHPRNLPHRDPSFEAMVVWMHPEGLREGKSYLIKQTTNAVPGEVTGVGYRIDVNTLHRQASQGGLEMNEIGRASFRLTRPIFFDPYKNNRATGSFIVVDRRSNVTVGAGMILDRQPTELTQSKRLADVKPGTLAPRSLVTAEQRGKICGHKAGAVWLTGLPKSGKSTIAFALEKKLADLGCHVLVLDGSTMRQGLSRDLGFSADDRSENSRRAAEVARICADAGLLVIANFVSPYASDRTVARETIGAGRFLEVYVNTPVDVCEKRDPETYGKARSGELRNFTGVSAPYETPANPDLLLPNHELDAAACVEKTVELLRARGIIS